MNTNKMTDEEMQHQGNLLVQHAVRQAIEAGAVQATPVGGALVIMVRPEDGEPDGTVAELIERGVKGIAVRVNLAVHKSTDPAEQRSSAVDLVREFTTKLGRLGLTHPEIEDDIKVLTEDRRAVETSVWVVVLVAVTPNVAGVTIVEIAPFNVADTEPPPAPTPNAPGGDA